MRKLESVVRWTPPACSECFNNGILTSAADTLLDYEPMPCDCGIMPVQITYVVVPDKAA